MDLELFRQYGHELIDWMADYFKNIENYPVKAQVKPGEIINQLPKKPPLQGEAFEEIMNDFNQLIMPGITHWQHPSFFAYFNANASYPSILAEMLTATLGTQCMSWVTSPAATELEERMMQWLRQLIGLPENFTGVIHDTASVATLCSLLTAREKKSDFRINREGFNQEKQLTIYCSIEAHSSVEKAVKIAGFGSENLRKIAVDNNYAMITSELEKMIKKDINNGYQPLAVIAAIGTTGSTAVDPLLEISTICKKYQIWLHVDAAYAGTALLLPEFRWIIQGIEEVDTFVFNPHKWMFTHFDCSAYFVKDKEALIKTFEILPEYLKTQEDQVNNYRNWGIQLGRRFRALKLWFVIRNFGQEGLIKKVKKHIQWTHQLEAEIKNEVDFELLTPPIFATICFRYKPDQLDELEQINQINALLLEKLNQSGKLYLTHTKLDGIYTLRFVIGQTYSEERHIQNAWSIIKKTAREL